MKRKKHTKSKGPNSVLKGIKNLVSITVLTAFVLGVVYLVREIAFFDPIKYANITNMVLTSSGVDSSRAGQLAGGLLERVLGSGINVAGYSTFKKTNAGVVDTGNDAAEGVSDDGVSMDEEGAVAEELLFQVALFADSHNYNGILSNAIEIAKKANIGHAFHLGDFTDWGDIGSLQNAKEVLDQSGLTYYVLPGDHDLAESASLGLPGPRNFIRVFGRNYRSVIIEEYKFVLLDNSANYTAVDTVQMEWFQKELADADFVLLSQPVYLPANSIFYQNRMMGIVDGEEVKKLREQADEILDLIRDSNVQAVFYADHHMSSTAKDPVKKDLTHYGVGAIVANSEGLRNLQKSRYSTLSVYSYGDYAVNEVVLE